MKEKKKQWLNKEQLSKWFQRDNLIILVLSGVLLFIIALPTKEADGQSAEKESRNNAGVGLDFGSGANWSLGTGINGVNGTGTDSTDSTGIGGTGAGDSISVGGMSVYSSEYSYAIYLEERLEKILSGAGGVGKVEVMITLESSEELIVEKDKLHTFSDIKETDAQGGERATSQSDSQENTIFSTDGNSGEPYVVMRMLPRVEGILVVAEGAGSGTVNKSITEMVQALFDVEAHKIKVVKMEDDN